MLKAPLASYSIFVGIGININFHLSSIVIFLNIVLLNVDLLLLISMERNGGRTRGSTEASAGQN